ncbi:MAG: hypothetical protein IPN95_29955 [Bacteroidetes bacterium]|nr:hypothetical protein [Bacteroidota bacterium]
MKGIYVLLACWMLLAGCTTPRPWYNRSYDRQLLQPPTPPLPTAPGTFTLFRVRDRGDGSQNRSNLAD